MEHIESQGTETAACSNTALLLEIGVGPHEVEALLAAAQGDVSKAANMFFAPAVQHPDSQGQAAGSQPRSRAAPGAPTPTSSAKRQKRTATKGSKTKAKLTGVQPSIRGFLTQISAVSAAGPASGSASTRPLGPTPTPTQQLAAGLPETIVLSPCESPTRGTPGDITDMGLFGETPASVRSPDSRPSLAPSPMPVGCSERDSSKPAVMQLQGQGAQGQQAQEEGQHAQGQQAQSGGTQRQIVQLWPMPTKAPMGRAGFRQPSGPGPATACASGARGGGDMLDDSIGGDRNSQVSLAGPSVTPDRGSSQPMNLSATSGHLFKRSCLTLPLATYDPVEHACWRVGQPPPFLHLVCLFEVVDATKKRLEIQLALTNFFRSLLAVSPEELSTACLLVTGKIGAAHEEGHEFNVGGATVGDALRESNGVSRARISELHAKLGDLGCVASQLFQRPNQVLLRAPVPLTLPGLRTTLRHMSTAKGPGSGAARKNVVLGLMRATRDAGELKYLVRLLLQNLRVGASWKSIIGPLARAVEVHRLGVGRTSKASLDAAAAAATQAYHLLPDWEKLVPELCEHGAQGLAERCQLHPGVPIKPQLARICGGVADGLRLLGPGCFLAEHKYDGTRAQIHVWRGSGKDVCVRIFSRNSEDKTSAFPDVVSLVKQAVGLGPGPGPHQGRSDSSLTRPQPQSGSEADDSGADLCLVLDAEVVGVECEAETGEITRLLAFQELATRQRGAVSEHEVSVRVAVFVFDILHSSVAGGSLLHKSLRERLAVVPQALPGLPALRGRVQEAARVEVQLGSGVMGRAPLAEELCGPRGGARNGAGSAACDDELSGQQPGTALGVAGSKDRRDAGGAGRDVGVTNNEALGGEPGEDGEGGHGAGSETDGGRPSGVGLPVRLEEGKGEGSCGVQVLHVPGPVEAEPVLMQLMMEALDVGAEGLMLKRLDGPSSTYEPSKRSDAWIKLKKDYCAGMQDSLDLVVIGAWQGQGRKAAFLSPFLLAAYDPRTQQLSSVCRCMSGFTDAFYGAATERLMATRLTGPKPDMNTRETPTFWFEPREVWEICGAELTLSPVHCAAQGTVPGTDRGLSLRFPRFIRIREDKGVEDASSPDFLRQMYLAQLRRPQPAGPGT